MEHYRATLLTKKGGPEVLQVVELPIPELRAGEVRVRVRASGVGSTDVTMRRGFYPFAPRIPFAPGYEVVGEVVELGPGVSSLRVGQRVAALTVHGGYGEQIVRKAEEWVPIPDGVSDEDVVALILNYVTAWQMIERTTHAKKGQIALVTGANGGVGTALMELLALRGVRVIAAASKSKHDLIRSFGAEPILSRDAPLDEEVRAIVPEGVDLAYDAVGGKTIEECVRATKRGGHVVGYGFMGTRKGDKASNWLVARMYFTVFVLAKLRGRKSSFYGITALYRWNPKPFHEDLAKLMQLLEAHEIHPKIATRLPLLEARRGNELIERGGIEGKIVLLA
ncbi:MAG: medium chain dehydrogenase/reductase family protein [Polyangiales bacterium]